MIDLHAPLLWGQAEYVRHDFLRISRRRIAECRWAEWHVDEPLMAFPEEPRMDWLRLVVWGGGIAFGIGCYVACYALGRWVCG